MRPRVLFCGALLMAPACGGRAESTATVPEAGPTEAGPTEAGPTPDAAAAAPPAYLMGCGAQWFVQEFAATATFTPSASGGGTLDFAAAPLVADATSLSQTTAAPTPETEVAVAADGTCTVALGMTTIPGASQNDGVSFVFSSLTFDFQIGPGQSLCATLHAVESSPGPAAVTGPCIFVPVAGPAPLPTLLQSQFHCP